MKNYIKLLQTVDLQGGLYVRNPVKNAKTEWSLDRIISPKFAALARDCQPFVFSAAGAEPVAADLSANAEIADNLSRSGMEPLDAPFTVFSIEMLEGSITRPKPGDNPIFTDCIMVYEESGPPMSYWLVTLSRYEQAGAEPGYFAALEMAVDRKSMREVSGVYAYDPDGENEVTLLSIGGQIMLPSQIMLQIVRSFLDRLGAEAAGLEKTNERIKVRSGGKKEIVKIRRLIHIAPKVSRSIYAGGKREIEWSHRWFSRGHWRALPPDRLGKNRAGLYVEVGRTWVEESIKGPEHKDLVAKTRLVHE